MAKRLHPVLQALSSLKLAIGCLLALMVLVVLCTLAQVDLGTHQAVEKYFRGAFLYWGRVPIFPAGGTVGAVLLLNLVVSHFTRFRREPRKAGIWLVHAGLVLLVLGEFVAGTLAVETQLPIEEGATAAYSESLVESELAVVDPSPADHDAVVSVSERRLARGGLVELPGLPLRLRVLAYYPNADVAPRPEGAPASLATAGAGPGLVVQPRPRVTTDDARDLPAAFVEALEGDRSLGVYLLSAALGAGQAAEAGGRTYLLSLRPLRRYLPFTLTLKDFRHDVYPGTDIPKNFSSLVRLKDPRSGEDRDVLIYMNSPLRYDGRTFYQASFGKGDTLSVLQVVENPGWLLPYAACAMVGAGLLVQFLLSLAAFQRRRLAAACLLAALVPGAASASGLDVSGFASMPVLHNGRLKPMDTVARTSLLMLRGRQSVPEQGRRLDAVEWLLELMTRPERADGLKVFRIEDPEVRGALGLQPKEKYFSFNELRPSFGLVREQAELAGRVEAQRRSRFQAAVFNLEQRLSLYQRLKNSLRISESPDFLREVEEYERALGPGVAAVMAHQRGPSSRYDAGALARIASFFSRYRLLAEVSYFKALPPAPGEGPDAWLNMGEGLLEGLREGTLRPEAKAYAAMLEAYRRADAAEFDRRVEEGRRLIEDRAPAALRAARAERAFNRLQPFLLGILLYTAALVMACLSWLGKPRLLTRASAWAVGTAFAVHTLGLAARMALQGRPPVTNLYSSAVFVGWAGVLLALVLERFHRKGLGTALGAAIGGATLVIAHNLAAGGDTLEMMQAVLDSNFWLATHVVVITIGYSSMFLAGALGHVHVFRRLLDPAFDDGPAARQLGQMTYGVVCFATLFSFVGTILGGIWADQSWGRFWGWDPKENGALLIVLWCAVILHARWGGYARARGLAVMAVAGNVITSLSWFGVNMLGIGLHSYGFMDKAFWWLMAFAASQLAVISLGLLPPGWALRARA